MLVKLISWCCPKFKSEVHEPLCPQDRLQGKWNEENESKQHQSQVGISCQLQREMFSSSGNSKENELLQAEKVLEKPPIFQNFPSTPIIKQKSMEKIKDSKFLYRSHIWDIEDNSDILYLDPTNYCFCSFYFRKKWPSKPKINDLLTYYLNRSQKHEEQKDSYNAIVSQGFFYEKDSVQRWLHHQWIQVGPSESSDAEFQVIKTQKLGKGIQMNRFDKVVIMAAKIKNYQEIFNLCLEVINSLSPDKAKQIVYIFPHFLTLTEISCIVFQGMEKVIAGEPMDKAILDLTFDMYAVEISAINSGIIVKPRNSKIKKEYYLYDQKKMSIPIFPFDYTQETKSNHSKLIRFLRGKTLNQYLALRKKKTENLAKFHQQIKDCFPRSLTKNHKTIPQISQNQAFFYIIPPSTKQFIRPISQEHLHKISTDTPVKKQWDYNLKGEQILGKKKVYEEGNLENISPEELEAESFQDDFLPGQIQEELFQNYNYLHEDEMELEQVKEEA